MTDNKVEAKCVEIIEALAAETGVSVEDVKKLMNKLGLEQSLRRRCHDDQLSGESSLSNVTHNVTRIATSLAPI